VHAARSNVLIDYRATTVEEMGNLERFDIVLAMEVVEHVTDVGLFLQRCAALIVGAEYVLRWLPRGTHQWGKFVTPGELAQHLHKSRLEIAEQTGVVYTPFADRWSLSSDMDVNYMVTVEAYG
jgi:2-polyprenyl-6-hydroxyphenyl methylase/3-demethylubiquinone-9 3-methyltransferase